MSVPIGRFAADEALRRFEAALMAAHDPLRPLGRYVVTDNSQWSEVGASYVAVNINGARKLAIYRDGPQPAVGSALHVVRTGPQATAPWLAFPQAEVVAVGPVASAPGSAKAIVIAPTGWQLPAYDDSAWLPTVAATGYNGIAGAALVRPDAASSPTAYFRQPFVIPAGVTTATLHLAANDAGLTGIYVNGVTFYEGPAAQTTYDIDIGAAIVPGATNLLAFGAQLLIGTITTVAYKIEFA